MSLLVRSVFTLIGNNISESEFHQCEYDLLKFVYEYEMLYGVENMIFNVHILIHLVHSVRMSRSLWATRCVYKRQLFTCTQYSAAKRTNNTIKNKRW